MNNNVKAWFALLGMLASAISLAQTVGVPNRPDMSRGDLLRFHNYIRGNESGFDPLLAVVPASAGRTGIESSPGPATPQNQTEVTASFAFGSAELRPSQLDEIADALDRHPPDGKLTITGYADHLGNGKYNEQLSLRRAEAVRTYLIAKGFEAGRMVAIGAGEREPLAVCSGQLRPDLIQCLEPNRRVEIKPSGGVPHVQ